MGIYDRGYYRDDPPPGLTPSWNNRSPVSVIIIICVVCQLLNLIFKTPTGNRLSDLMALHATDAYKPWMWWRLLTYGFAHSYLSTAHILFNMMSLWFLGRAVEEQYGWKEFWRIYLFSIIFGGIAFLVAHQFYGLNNSVVGASGAVLAITMLFVFNFPSSTIYLLVFPMPAWMMGLIVVIMNFVFRPSGGMVAYDVHIAGILFAAIYFYGNLSFGFLDNIPGSFRFWRRKTFGPKLKKFDGHDAGSSSSDDEASQADLLLDKIQQHGMDSLTSKEKKFLERYSQKVRQKQKST
jgi:membrane associated rhomboid family serine protease